MDQQVISMSKRRRVILKFYVLFMNGLAGSLIYCFIDYFGIRGLKWEHYAFMSFALLAAGVVTITVWPSKAER